MGAGESSSLGATKEPGTHSLEGVRGGGGDPTLNGLSRTGRGRQGVTAAPCPLGVRMGADRWMPLPISASPPPRGVP